MALKVLYGNPPLACAELAYPAADIGVPVWFACKIGSDSLEHLICHMIKYHLSVLSLINMSAYDRITKLRDCNKNAKHVWWQWVLSLIPYYCWISIRKALSVISLRNPMYTWCGYERSVNTRLDLLTPVLPHFTSTFSDTHPRQIDESMAKQLEAELGSRCKYYETCATYGLNVEHVFQDGEWT